MSHHPASRPTGLPQPQQLSTDPPPLEVPLCVLTHAQICDMLRTRECPKNSEEWGNMYKGEAGGQVGDGGSGGGETAGE